MKKLNLSSEEFAEIIFSQDVDNILDCELYTRISTFYKEENDDDIRKMAYDPSSGIIYAYGIHHLGVIRIEEKNGCKYLFLPLNNEYYKIYKQSRTVEKYESLIKEFARKNGFIISYYIPEEGSIYYGFSKDKRYKSLILRKERTYNTCHTFMFPDTYDLLRVDASVYNHIQFYKENTIDIVWGNLSYDVTSKGNTSYKASFHFTNGKSELARSLNRLHTGGILIPKYP